MKNPIGYIVNGKFHETIIPALVALLEKRAYLQDVDLDEIVRELASSEIDEIYFLGLNIKAKFE